MKDEADKISQSSRIQFKFTMPKLEIELFAMDQSDFTEHHLSEDEAVDFSCSSHRQ